ncbi:MAG: response regulator [Candidatus Micrarchaeia archaeon]
MEKNNFEENEKNEETKERTQKEQISKNPLEDTLYHTERKGLVLILEDSPEVIRFYTRTFKNYNYRLVSSLREGEEEIERLEKEGIEPKVLIADFHLPDGESTIFVEKLRNKYPKLKVILCSSDDSAVIQVKHDASFEKGQIIKIRSKLDEFLSQ